MSAHALASTGSKNLCDLLIIELQKKIPRLECARSKSWCGLYEPGRNRFAFISHRKRQQKIEVWCAGDIDDLTASTSINVIPREKIRPGWEERYPARFSIENESDIEAASDLLYRVSYASS